MNGWQFTWRVVLPCFAFSFAATATDMFFGKMVTCGWLSIVCLVLFLKIYRLNRT